MLREDFQNDVATARFAIIQGRRESVRRSGGQAKDACRFRGDGQGILRYLEESEDLEVSVTEVQEQMGMCEDAGVSFKQVARRGKGKKRERLLLQVLWQDEEDVCSARLARCNPQLKGLGELERRCRDTMQEVKVLRK